MIMANETYQTTHHKYTINLPRDLYLKAKAKAEAVGIYSVSIYFRSILIREINNDLTADEILSGRKESEVTDSRKHRRVCLDNIEAYHRRNAFRVNIKKFLDKVISRQYTLF